MELIKLKCEPCQSNARAIDRDEYGSYLDQLPGWKIIDKEGIPALEKHYEFTHYTQCLTFVQQVGHLAEEQDHHPEMTVSWGKVSVCWWTHTIGGLHLNDFILAAKCDEIAEVFYVS